MRSAGFSRGQRRLLELRCLIGVARISILEKGLIVTVNAVLNDNIRQGSEPFHLFLVVVETQLPLGLSSDLDTHGKGRRRSRVSERSMNRSLFFEQVERSPRTNTVGGRCREIRRSLLQPGRSTTDNNPILFHE